jgi:hypothetical protein
MGTEQTPELRKLVESVARGERLLLWPPGTWFLIVIIMLLIFSTVTGSGSAISLFASGLSMKNQVLIQFIGMVCMLFFVILPGIMITRGHKAFKYLMVFYSSFIGLSDLFMLMLDVGKYQLPITISLLSAVVTLALIYRPSFIVFCEYFYLLQNIRKQQ